MQTKKLIIVILNRRFWNDHVSHLDISAKYHDHSIGPFYSREITNQSFLFIPLAILFNEFGLTFIKEYCSNYDKVYIISFTEPTWYEFCTIEVNIEDYCHIGEYFRIISSLNAKNLNVMLINCYGFYNHEHFLQLPYDSVLITLSDYTTRTSAFSCANNICSDLITSNIAEDFTISKLILTYIRRGLYKSEPKYCCPVVFMSYYKNNKPYIDCILFYIKYKFIVNPLRYICEFIIKNPSVPDSTIIKVLRTFYLISCTNENYLVMNIKIIAKKYEDFKRNYLHYTLKAYAQPLYLCKQINYIYNKYDENLPLLRKNMLDFYQNIYKIYPYKNDIIPIDFNEADTFQPYILLKLINHLEKENNIIDLISEKNIIIKPL